MAALTLGIAQEVIASDTNAIRFENFCNEIIGQVEGGAVVLPTSITYDLARDGRGNPRSGAVWNCVSLNDSADAKALADIQRAKPFLKSPARLFFCSSQKLTEHATAKIEAELRKHLPADLSVTVYGALQLARYATQWDEISQKHYRAEVDDILHALRDGAEEETEIPGIRLALISAAHDDSAAIRTELYRSGILTALADGQSRSLGELARDFAAKLRLNRNVAPEVLVPHANTLVAAGHVLTRDERFQISESGRSEFDAQSTTAVRELLSGRQRIRDALEASLGQRLLDDFFAKIWTVFEEKVSFYFYSRGEHLVHEVSSILGVESDAREGADSVRLEFSFTKDLAGAVAEVSSHPQQRDELATAIKDLFSDRVGPAPEWLLRLCASYLAVCSAGLEASCGKAIGQLLSKLSLVFDTDVCLSLLCEGEPDHDSVNAIHRRWPKLGGTIFYAEPVLEEVAYHAWISEHDYAEVRRWLPGSPQDRLHVIENAFVRGFAELVAVKTTNASGWNRYIAQYRGSSQYDWSKLAGVLASEGIRQLPPRSSEEVELEKRVHDHLSGVARDKFNGVALRNATDKARRDALLYASMVRHLRNLHKSDPGAGCLLVSSARRLGEVEAQFREAGETHFVVSIATVLYLLSLVPEVSLGLTAMKAFLFDERRVPFSSELERLLLRVLKDSDTVSLPYSRRGTLRRAMRERLVTDARQQGEKNFGEKEIVRLEHLALRSESRPRTVELFRQALDDVAANSTKDDQIRDLKNQVELLEKRLAEKGQSGTK